MVHRNFYFFSPNTQLEIHSIGSAIHMFVVAINKHMNSNLEGILQGQKEEKAFTVSNAVHTVQLTEWLEHTAYVQILTFI